MITGTVNSRLEAVIRFHVQGAAGQSYEIEAVIDTGFTGELTLPPSMIVLLVLPFVRKSAGRLANGSMIQYDVHSASILWDGTQRRVLVQSVDAEPLVGATLLAGHDLKNRLVPGGMVQVEAVS